MQRLMQMFAPEIQSTLSACQGKGQVDLEAGAGASGEVVCGDGTAQPEIPFQSYVSMMTDVMAASTLLGMREQMAANSQLTPQTLSTLLNTAEGRSFVQNTLQSGLVQTGIIAANSDAGARFTNQIVDKLLPTIQNTDYMQTLLGTEAEYSQVVQSFCTAPGMPIEQAQQTFPDLSTVQLFAICIQESGLPQ